MSTDRQTTCPHPTTAVIPTAGGDQVQTQTASHPKATYEQVVADETLFMETLANLHNSRGTKFAVPKIGGKPLDLHLLFVEVTRRGGIKKVITDRNWKDVTSTFTFPSTITSASFMLRKFYISLLQTYEQVYYFRKKDDLKLPSNASLDAKAINASEASKATVSTILTDSADHQKTEQKPLGVGSWVKGKVQAKFENGYMVMASFGSETFNGILYHVPLQPSKNPNSPHLSHRRGQKRSRKENDLSKMSGYNVFYAEHYSQLRPLHSGKEKAITKHINSMWISLTESEKEVYQARDKRS